MPSVTGSGEGEAGGGAVVEEPLQVILTNVPFTRGPPSERTNMTDVASSVGSYLCNHDAFLKSVTFRHPQYESIQRRKNAEAGTDGDGCDTVAEATANIHGMDWHITFVDPIANASFGKQGLRQRMKTSARKLSLPGRDPNNPKLRRPVVEDVDGIIALSKLTAGDRLRSINSKKIGVSYNAARANDLLRTSYQRDGYLSVEVGNDSGVDVLVEATVIKPRPSLTAEDIGITAWYWGSLSIKNIEENSMFAHTCLKMDDKIVSINDIVCDQMNADDFHRILDELPREVTITVKRARQRWNGDFT